MHYQAEWKWGIHILYLVSVLDVEMTLVEYVLRGLDVHKKTILLPRAWVS